MDRIPEKLSFSAFTICYNLSNHLLYIITHDERIIKLNIVTSKYETLSLTEDIQYAQMILVHNDIHIIGGYAACHSILRESNES